MDHNLGVLDKLLSLSENLRNSNKAIIFKRFLTEVNRKTPTATFLQRLFSCSDNSDRVDAVKEHFEWIPLDPEIRSKYRKNKDISSAFRSLGNTAYQKERYVDAVRSYNMALLFAIPGEPELALAYANRSVALHYMGLTEEALNDIDLACTNHHSTELNLLRKLEDRRTRFLAHLARRLKTSSFEQQLNDQISKRSSFYKNLFTLKTPNPLAPALDESIDIKYNSSHGRHLVANRDISIGDTVLVESPFVAVLDKALNWDVEHCHHCLKKNFRCIPCTNCVFAMYCNEECRAEAEEKYHQYECPCLPELHCNLHDVLAKNFYLVFKLICLMGPRKLLAMYTEHKKEQKMMKSEENNYNIVPGVDPSTGIYEPNSYIPIYKLMSIINPKEGYYFILLSLILSRTLDDCTDFFDSVATGIQKREYLDFTAKLILHHFETFRRNVYGLSEITEMDGVTLRAYMESKPKHKLDYGCEEFAVGAFATASLANHSCDQNVMRFTGKTFGTMAIVAIKPVKKGEELVITYGPRFGTEVDATCEERQRILSTAYDFTCDCIACKNDWPRGSDLILQKPKFCCSSCASKFLSLEKATSQFLKCQLSGQFKCSSCSRQFSSKLIEKEYAHHVKALEVCEKLLLHNSPHATISSLISALQFFETTVCPPNYPSLLGSVLYREAINLIIFFSDC